MSAELSSFASTDALQPQIHLFKDSASVSAIKHQLEAARKAGVDVSAMRWLDRAALLKVSSTSIVACSSELTSTAHRRPEPTPMLDCKYPPPISTLSNSPQPCSSRRLPVQKIPRSLCISTPTLQ